MKQCLFTLLIVMGLVPLVLPVTRNYHLITLGRTWRDAQAYCRATYSDLATVESEYHMVQLQNEFQRQNLISNAWIGLYDDVDSWYWSMNHLPLGNMKKWNLDPAQPDNYGASELCGCTSSNGWADVHCSLTLPFVCFDDTKTGADAYIFYTNAVTWLAAQAYCRTHHTDLASSRDEVENSLIMGKTGAPLAWIGLTRDSWKWSDGTRFSTVKWANGRPQGGVENYGFLSLGQIDDASCSDNAWFFCHSVTSKRQILRMMVQSDQDLNSLAVKVALLEQITQKLKERGKTQDIAVKWKRVSRKSGPGEN